MFLLSYGVIEYMAVGYRAWSQDKWWRPATIAEMLLEIMIASMF